MRISIIQQNIVWNKPVANLVNMERLLGKAPESDIYLFPEMCSTGFCMEPEGVAEAVGGATAGKMMEWARQLNAVVAGTVMTESKGLFYNRMYFAKPDGELLYYDKTHLFAYSGEDKVYTRGTKSVIWEFRGVVIKPAICYDLRFPVFLNNRENYDLLLLPANFPTCRMLAWDTLVRARAIENQCYVAAANRVGQDLYGNYIGHSVIINPLGEKMAGCKPHKQGVASIEMDMELIKKIRKSFPMRENDFDAQ